MVGKNFVGAAVWVAVACVGVLSADADVVTNVWITPGGGQWDATNQNGVLTHWAGGKTEVADVFHTVCDFKLLSDTGIKSSDDVTTPCDGMIFSPYLEEGQEPSQDPATWPVWHLLQASKKEFALCSHVLGYFPLCVSNGWLVVDEGAQIIAGTSDGALSWGPVRKEGNGAVRINSFFTHAYPGRPLEIEEGRAMTMVSSALAYTDVRVTNPAGEFVLTNYSPVTVLGALSPLPGTLIPLTGNELQMGQMSSAVLPAEVCGTGLVTAVSRTLIVTNIHPGIAYGARAGRLRLDSTSSAMPAFAHYTFEDSNSLGADSSGHGYNLTASGEVKRVYDGERGGYVARFTATADTGGKLVAAISGTDELTGDTDYTISLWAKTARPCANNYPTMISLGKEQKDNSLVQFRFSSSACTKLLVGHWRDIADFSGILPTVDPDDWNPAAWHHYIVMREGGIVSLWIDGRCVLHRRDIGLTMTLPKPTQINLGWMVGSNRFFHGDLDDVRIYSHAVGIVGVNALFAGREPVQYGSLPSGGETLSIPVGTKLSLALNGEIQLKGEPTLAATNITVSSPRGALVMPEGGTLTLTGTGSYAGGTKGSNKVVKDGAARLVLSGALDHTGGTEVKDGTLTLRHYAALPPALAAYDFEDGLGVDAMDGVHNLTTQVEVTRVYDEERGGHVARFPGTATQKLETQVDSQILTGDSDYTLSVWAKPDADCPDTGTFVSLGREADFCEIVLRYKDLDAGTMVLSHWGGTLDFGEITKPELKSPQGAWHHYVAVRKGTTYTIYLDGKPVWSITKAGTLKLEVSKEVCLGRQLNKTDRQFKGLLDDVHIYACALDADQLALLNQRGEPSAVARGSSPDVAATLPPPILHYAFEDADNIGFDSAAGVHHLSKVDNGSMTLIDSPLGGKALQFSAIKGNAYLQSTTVPEILPANGEPFTVSLWLQTSRADARAEAKYGSHTPTFICWGNPEAKTINFMLAYHHQDSFAHGISTLRSYVRRANDQSVLDLSSGDEVLGLRVGEAAQRWHHYAVVYDPAVGMRYYVDGECLQNLRHNGAFTTDVLSEEGAAFYLGAKTTCTNATFRGAMDEVKVFASALSAREIRTLMRADAGALRVLPEGGAVTIDEGATLEVNGTDETFGALSGGGTFNLASGVVGLTGASTFDGVLKGAGMLRLPAGASLALTQTPTDFTGYVDLAGGAFTLPEGSGAIGATFRLTVVDGVQPVTCPGAVEIPDGAAIALTASETGPLVTAAGTVTICGGGTVTLPTPKTRGTWTLARGTSVIDKGTTDLGTRWRVANLEGNCTPKFFVSNGDFVCRVLSGGTLLLVR